MSSLTQALSIALSGLQTSTSLISIASNNISNAQTPGYTDKTATLSSVVYGSDSGGVTISSYGRAADEALSNNYNTSTTQASYYGTQNSYMSQVQSILDSSSTNPTISADIANFSSAWTQYSAQPESAIQQQGLIVAGRQLANDVNSASTQIGSLDSQVLSDTQTTLKSLNSDLKQVAQLNGLIQQATTSGNDTTNLEDQRDTLVNQISGFVGISVQSRSNGQIAIYSSSGQLMVDAGTAASFSYDGTNLADQTGATINGSLNGGSLQAEIDFRDESPTAASSTTPGVGVIAKLKSQLSTLVSAFTNATGTPASAFASTYAAAATASTATGATQNGETVDSNFFSVVYNTDGTADPSTFALNPDLANGTSEIPQTNAQTIANSFNSTASYTASGLAASNVTVAQLGTAVLSSFQSTANTISSQSTTATSQQTYYKQALSNSTGVNIDTELANLVAYQNSYAASAHVISTVETMLTDLMNSIT